MFAFLFPPDSAVTSSLLLSRRDQVGRTLFWECSLTSFALLSREWTRLAYISSLYGGGF